VETVETVRGEHQVYGVAWLRDGGAVVASTQAEPSRDGPPATWPGSGSFLHVRADATVELVDPQPGVDGVIHSPIGLPPSAPSPQ
jgi:hypothetical protein